MNSFQRAFLESALVCLYTVFFDHLNEMVLQQLPADSLSAWPREAACIESTVAAGCELCAFKGLQ